MWIFTPFGFFSVVMKEGKDDLTVRSRVKGDLENLREYLPNLGRITETFETDYQFRAKVSHEDFAEAMKKMVTDIDYANFKEEVERKQGTKREKLYSGVWFHLQGLASEKKKILASPIRRRK